MRIQRLVGTNFLSYESLDISLAGLGLVLVEGENRDQGGSNGSGKSSIFECLRWTIFGTTERFGSSGSDVVRVHNGSSLGSTSGYVLCDCLSGRLEIFRYNGDKKYGNKVLLVLDGQEKTMGGNRETQAEINKYLGIDEQSFVSTVMFPQGAKGFASYTDAKQKEILDKVLGMERFSRALERAKSKQSTLNSEYTDLKLQIESSKNRSTELRLDIKNLYTRSKEFEESKSAKILDLQSQIARLHQPVLDPQFQDRKNAAEFSLRSSGVTQAREIAQQTNLLKERITRQLGQVEGVISSLLVGLVENDVEPEKLEKTSAEYNLEQIDWNGKASAAIASNRQAQERLKKIQSCIDAGANTTHCSICGQELSETAKSKMFGHFEEDKVHEENNISNTKLQITDYLAKVEESRLNLDKAKAWEEWKARHSRMLQVGDKKKEKANLVCELQTCDRTLESVQEILNQANDLTKEIKLCTDEISAFNQLFAKWEQEKGFLTRQLHEAENSTDPFKSLIASNEGRLSVVEKDIESLLARMDILSVRMEYNSYWIDGFGNKGVKSLLLDQVAPFITERTNEYLEYLTNGSASLDFETQTTLKSGEKRDKINLSLVYKNAANSYIGASGGESRRLDISLLCALSDLNARRAGNPIHLRLLDEPFDNLDSLGCEQVVALLKEKILPKSDTVLVMSHNDDLKSLFDQRIMVIKENGISRIEQ